jgi:hypothetical protein
MIHELDTIGIGASASTSPRGLGISINFNKTALAVPPVLDTQPGSFYGCKVWQETPAQAGDTGLDEGTVAFYPVTTTPVIPPCKYVGGTGYLCRSQTGTGGMIAGDVSGRRGIFFTDSQLNATTDLVGQYLSGASYSPFVIIMVMSPSTVLLETNQSVPDQTLSDTITWSTYAGGGIAAPGGTTFVPPYFPAGEHMMVMLTPSGDNEVPSFSETINGNGIGDAFMLDTASQGTIHAIPTNGTAFTLGCDGSGGTCGNADVSTVLIQTTDSALFDPNSLPFDPPINNLRVVARCATAGAGHITIPANVDAYLASSGATWIQATFLRSAIRSGTASGAHHDVLAGHGIAGFTMAPPPDGGS